MLFLHILNRTNLLYVLSYLFLFCCGVDEKEDDEDPITCLVVDDTASNRKMLKMALQTRNLRVLEAENGLEAVMLMRNSAEARRVSIIFMDSTMPVMVMEH